MASPEYSYMPSTSDYDDDSYYLSSSDPPSHVDSFISNKVMVVAIVILFCLILLIASLHIFCRWAWRSDNSLNSSRVLFMNRNHAHFEARRSGLTKDAIAQLPIFTYKLPAGESSTDLEGDGEKPGALLECAVCLSEFQENEKGRLLPNCKHSFHLECIDMWFFSHSTCPLCRAEAIPTITNSDPLTHSTVEEEESVSERAQDAIVEGTASVLDERSRPLNPMAVPASENVGSPLQIPTNTLFFGESVRSIPTQVGSSQSSEKPWQPPSSSRSTRTVPHITIEIPTSQDINLTSPACISLSSWSSRCASPHDQMAYSSCRTLKSPGFRESVKRMLNIQSSKEKKALPSSSQEEIMESPKA